MLPFEIRVGLEVMKRFFISSVLEPHLMVQFSTIYSTLLEGLISLFKEYSQRLGAILRSLYTLSFYAIALGSY